MSDKEAARARKEPSTLTAAEQTLASVANLEPLDTLWEFWQALTPDLTVRDFFKCGADQQVVCCVDGRRSRSAQARARKDPHVQKETMEN